MSTIEFLRQFRMGEYAIFDFLASLLGIYFLSPVLSKIFRKLGLDIPKQAWLYLTLPLSIMIHILINSITPMTRDFMDIHGHYFLKVFIITLLVLGVKDIRRVEEEPVIV